MLHARGIPTLSKIMVRYMLLPPYFGSVSRGRGGDLMEAGEEEFGEVVEGEGKFSQREDMDIT